jgi:DNA-nicking Smr family endonuclease
MGRRRPPATQPPAARVQLHAAVVEDERDLHELTAAEAELELELFLAGLSRSRPGAVVRVITGRGNRSRGDPVLRPLVRRLLEGRLAPLVEDFAVESGGGAYRVRLRRGR